MEAFYMDKLHFANHSIVGQRLRSVAWQRQHSEASLAARMTEVSSLVRRPVSYTPAMITAFMDGSRALSHTDLRALSVALRMAYQKVGHYLCGNLEIKDLLPAATAAKTRSAAMPDHPSLDERAPGARVLTLRKHLGMTQMQLVRRSNNTLEQPLITRIEKGRHKLTTMKIRRGLALAFGLTPEDLGQYLDGSIDLNEVVRRLGSPIADENTTSPATPPEDSLVSAIDELVKAAVEAWPSLQLLSSITGTCRSAVEIALTLASLTYPAGPIYFSRIDAYRAAHQRVMVMVAERPTRKP